MFAAFPQTPVSCLCSIVCGLSSIYTHYVLNAVATGNVDEWVNFRLINRCDIFFVTIIKEFHYFSQTLGVQLTRVAESDHSR